MKHPFQTARNFLFGTLEVMPPDVWAEQEFIFNEQEVKGKCDFTGRNYMRPPLKDYGDEDMQVQTCVYGTGCGKTAGFILGMSWTIINDPFRGLYVMPSQKGPGGSERFISTRLEPNIKKTPAMAALLPETGQRYKINKQFVSLGGSHIDFVGGNSASQVASNRCSRIWIDETDKLPQRLKNEAGTGALVRERVEGVASYKIFESSTPTIEGGIIWGRLMQSNLRLYFVPCPECKKKFVYGWNKQFTAGLPEKTDAGILIPYSRIAWDKKAKRITGTWDLDKVFQTAHCECPHCGHQIFDWPDRRTKDWMDENGEYVVVKKGTPKHKGYHVSSLYAPTIAQEKSWGGRAIKFLDAHEGDGQEMKTFINSTLALPDVGQKDGTNRIELVSKPIAQTDWVTMLTADFHKNFPYLWFVVRRWCAFKLLPPFKMINGKSEFYEVLQMEENKEALQRANVLIDGVDAVWPVLAELMRFDSRTGISPIVEYLLAQKITGEKLCKLYDSDGQVSNLGKSKALVFRETILKMMGAPVTRGGDSELVAAGHCGLSGDFVWHELRDVIKEFRVGAGMSMPGRFVGIDTGYMERFNREVLRKCAESATEFKYYDPTSRNHPPVFYAQAIHNLCQVCPRDGYFPMKGYPINQRWNHGGVRNELNINVEDPFFGTPQASESVIEVLEFASGLFWLRKDDLRKKRSRNAYTVSPQVQFFPRIRNTDGTERQGQSSIRLEDYEKHLNEQFYDEEKGMIMPRHGKGGSQSRRHPYHMDDCETMQIALATHHEFFETEEK
jgi:Phage terminase large subunit gpA, ATPase domain/Terminase large subunit gpA, endonuclease domain